MVATLKFEVRGATYEAVPVKLERRKLYGYTDVVATDGSGEICQSARLDPGGRENGSSLGRGSLD